MISCPIVASDVDHIISGAAIASDVDYIIYDATINFEPICYIFIILTYCRPIFICSF